MSYLIDICEYWHSLVLKCTRKLVQFYTQLVPIFTNISSVTLYYIKIERYITFFPDLLHFHPDSFFRHSCFNKLEHLP